MFKKILVPVDGSEVSQKAVQTVADMAAQLDARVTLFHVVAPLPHPVRTVFNAKELQEQIFQDGLLILDQAKDIFTTQNLKAETDMVLGDYALEILDKARVGNYDLIVMGSRGKGAIEGFIMGSVTRRVSRHAPCSVMIVR